MESGKPGYVQARAVMTLVFNKQYTPTILPITVGGGRYANPNNNGNNSVLIANSQFKLYPNPATNSLTIAYSLSDNTQVNLNLYDVLGNKVANWSLPDGALSNNLVNENISSLAPGIYFYTIFENGRLVQRDKVVIVR